MKEDFFAEGRANGSGELLRGKNGSEVLRISTGVATIPPFEIDVVTSSEGIGLAAEASRTKANEKIESGKVFGPSSLTTSKHLGSREVLKILVVGQNMDWERVAF